VPFANHFERDIHFTKHGHKFATVDATDYERMADVFMYGALGPDTHECMRPVGPTGVRDRVRFDFGTHYQAIACIVPAFLRSFYPVELRFIARRGGEAGYFAHECGRMVGVNL
jgi:hypothetical protein